MILVVDTNIVYSAILNPKGNFGQLLISGTNVFEFYSVEKLNEEILNHKNKLQNFTGYSEMDFWNLYKLITKKVYFINENLIPFDIIEKSIDLVSNIDKNDTLFVALSLFLNAKLWTGDKKLINGLKAKNYDITISTQELYQKYIELETKF